MCDINENEFDFNGYILSVYILDADHFIFDCSSLWLFVILFELHKSYMCINTFFIKWTYRTRIT